MKYIIKMGSPEKIEVPDNHELAPNEMFVNKPIEFEGAGVVEPTNTPDIDVVEMSEEDVKNL